MSQKNVYTAVIERIFQSKFKPGMRELDFEREEIVEVCNELKLEVPKNLGDLVYSFRYRAALPESIQKLAGEGETWIIRPTGRAKYRFVLVKSKPIAPNENMSTTKVPEATPGVVAKYALSDEQALLAKVRYNRLVDIFTGVACYSLAGGPGLEKLCVCGHAGRGENITAALCGKVLRGGGCPRFVVGTWVLGWTWG